MPWRSSRNPWEILVSEVMLQQTQVARVVPVYCRFLERFPDPEALAGADRSEVIAAWEDLGYLRRAYNLQEAAKSITADGWPPPGNLERLPGVGPYTAAAVSAFAFGVQRPAVDINLRRVLSRWYGSALSGRDLERFASSSLGAADAREWNQAMMDLSSALCRPRNPQCAACPVERFCTDPQVQVSSPTQPRFEGSVRQARAMILKRLANVGPHSFDELVQAVPLERRRVRQAIESLEREGAVTLSDGRVVLG